MTVSTLRTHEEVVNSDVTVIGGGLAGVAAAISAARAGAHVALINNRPVLGGNSSSEIRVWVCGATAHGAQKFARETGVMGELFLENQYRNPEGNPHFWDQVVHDAVRAEPRISLYLNTDITEVQSDDVSPDTTDAERRIVSVSGWQQGSERRLRFRSEMFIDASGDGLVGALAGARYSTGREAVADYHEEWAPETADSHTLGSTLLFYTKDLHRPVRFVPPSIARDISATPLVIHREINARASGCDYWWIEWGGELDVVADNEAIRDELWAVVYGIWDHIKNSGEFDAESLTLEWVGSIPGKREYRRFIGDHVLTQRDIIDQTTFEDRIGIGGWSIDLHPSGGMYATEPGSKHLFPAGVYHIPFRSLYSINVENMLMAGRNISASHVAFGTTRVMATCAVTGEAAGAGAALAVRHGITPRQLADRYLGELHEALLRQDATILGVPWNSSSDLALTAQVRASSTLDRIAITPDADAEAISISHRDLGIHVPVNPSLDVFRLLVEADAPTPVQVELWGTGGGENHIPVVWLDTRTAVAEAGRSWLEVPFGYTPSEQEDVVVVVRGAAGVRVLVNPRPGPYGLLGLLGRAPSYDMQRPQTNSWSARELRRKTPVIEISPDTLAYHADNVRGGLARPFSGPRLWSSAGAAHGVISLTWESAVRVGSLEIIFNDDPDEDLINLHHHDTPFAVIPELVKDYDIDVLLGNTWTTLVETRDNRRRRRVHRFPSVETNGLRLRVLATNGAASAMVVAVRVFSAPRDE